MNLLEGDDQTPNEREEILLKWKDKSKEEILEAKAESDLYIKTILKQKDELREDYLKQREELLAKAKFEELLDRFENAPKEILSNTPAKEEESPKYNPKEIESLIENKIRQTKIIEQETKNFQTVETKLRERYGDNYKSVLREQQNSLGLSSDDINNLAKKSPEAFFRMTGLDTVKNESFETPPRNNQRNNNFAPRGEVKRNYAYYQELKKADPKIYFDSKISVQMHNDALAMGDRFYD